MATARERPRSSISTDHWITSAPAATRPEPAEAHVHLDPVAVTERPSDSEDVQALIEDLHRRQTHFSALAAHELHTPLTGILTTLLILERYDGEPGFESRRRDLLDVSIRQARRLEALCRDLLTVVGVSEGELTVKPETIEVAPVLESAANLLVEGDRRRVLIRAPRHLEVVADRGRLEQVIRHLLRNALKFSPPATVVRAEACSPGGPLAEVVVSDDGPGIPEHRLGQIFERFTDRGPAVAEGLGVGLWIVRELMEAMDGTVTAANRPGGGASFTLTLPTPQWSKNAPSRRPPPPTLVS